MVVFLKKCTALCLSVLLLIQCGCTVYKVETDPQEENDVKSSLTGVSSVQVNILPGSEMLSTLMTGAAQQYMRSHNDVEIQILNLQKGEDYNSQLMRRLCTGEDITAFCIGGSADLKTFEKYLQDLSLQCLDIPCG